MVSFSNTSDNSDKCPENINSHVNMSSGLTLVVVYIAVLSFNSLIIFVIFGVKHRSLRWSLDYLVSFLAITDLVSTLVGVPIPIIAYMQGFWPGSCTSGANQSFSTFNITCKLFYLFLVWGRLSTMFIITMMCIERFLAITRPFVHREIVTAGRLRKCVYGIWTSMFVYSLLPILNIGHVKLHWNVHLDAGETTTSSDPPYFFCFMDYSDLDVKQSSGLGNLIYSIIFVLFGCISLTIVITCVFFICRILLVRRPRFNATSSKKPTSASKTYSVKAPDATDEDQNTVKNKVVGKPSILDKSKSFLAKRRPQIKKFEPEELQFIALMLMIAGVFYITFLPTMVLVISNIAGHGLSENFTFWSMRLTSFIVVVNPLIYGLSNKIYRVGCLYVLKSCAGFFCCKKIPVPERLAQKKYKSSRSLEVVLDDNDLTAASNTSQLVQTDSFSRPPGKGVPRALNGGIPRALNKTVSARVMGSAGREKCNMARVQSTVSCGV
ncbi:prostaglandin E2 receptor EP4 subtype-like isoform X4 [Bolinopsis microptera]|uniref:prostaglandin E2 receptor EP4 subtype-like isoform X4 n=1 Tax=Bolinopsis microptera TaxID=2820187 RepID=UPI00307AD51E